MNKAGYKNGDFPLTECVCMGSRQGQEWPYRYCYRLTDSDQLVGVLYLYHTEPLKLDSEQETLLQGMTSEFSAMLERHYLQESLDQQKTMQLNVQQRIAKHTHATLGNNLAYLRMKLDQISAAYQVGDDSISKDLIQLRDTANVSYKQMRDLLIVLTPERTANLRSILTEYAQRAADRAGFNLEVQYSGTDRPLSPENIQRVFLILREAVENIEKHAQARNVQISFNWQDDGLRIHIFDDGRGFDANLPPTDKQLGLRFIRARVSEVNGEFGLASTINSGTKLSLYTPY
jgi:signal transduction histidine kinase